MPRVGPINRTDLIFCLRRLGFQGPRAGSKHSFMVRGTTAVRLPNPHRGDISVGLLTRLLRQAGISREEWEKV